MDVEQDITRGYIIVSFGPRGENVLRLVRSIRQHSQYPIVIITDGKAMQDSKVLTELNFHSLVLSEEGFKWKDSPRWPVRNCNRASAMFALDLFDSCCVLNDDMLVVHAGHADGFRLAERFGVCVPMNPRIYVQYNALGTDARPEDFNERVDGPGHAPACNVSPMFVCRLHDNAKTLMKAYIAELDVCMRGTLAFWRASWKCGVHPVYLPEQWCVCGSNAAYLRDCTKSIRGKRVHIETMMLHWGQEEVRHAFKAFGGQS